eukprot:Em0005g1550a
MKQAHRADSTITHLHSNKLTTQILDMVSILANPVQATEPLFERLSELTSVPADQLRCVVLLSLGYPLGAVYHYGFHPDHTNPALRHMVSTSIGLLFGLMCFGWVQMGVLFSVTGVCYAMLLLVPSKVVHFYTIVFAMASMSVAHIYRMMVDYGGWHLDFTGPLMLIVQRVTLTAFALRDGVARKEAELNEDQKLMKLTEVPSLLEYWSYNYNFHTFLAGPTCTLKEYLNFVDGSNFKTTPTQNGDGKVLELVASVFRSITESVNNYIGLGFSGYKEGKPVWDVCKNVRVFDVECPFPPRVCYERVPPKFWISPHTASFALSAIWHGFYPGYYICFVSFMFINEAARKMRTMLHHHFQTSPAKMLLYDLATMVTTAIIVDFAATCFPLLMLDRCILFWSYFYYIPLVVVVMVSFLPVPREHRGEGKTLEKTD